MIYEFMFLISLLLSLIIEIPLILLFLKLVYNFKKIDFKKIILVGIFATALTLPYLWFIFPRLFLLNYYIIIGEILVFLVEAFIYSYFLKIDIRKALLISFIANLISFLVGFLIFS